MDTRIVLKESDGGSGNFQLDNRPLAGMLGWAESGSVSLDTGGSLGVPVVQSIFPSTITGADTRQWLSVRGSGFTAISTVTLRTGNEIFIIPSSRTEFVDSGEIRVFVNLTSAAASWTAEVSNGSGKSSQLLAFQVSPPSVRPDGGIDFGTVAPGQTAEKSFVVRNNSGGPAALSVSLSGPFSVINGPGVSLAAGAEQSVTVRYSPTAAGSDVQPIIFQIGGQSIRSLVSGRSGTAIANTGAINGIVEGSDGNGGFVPLRNAKVDLNVAASLGDGLYRSTGHSTKTDSAGSYTLAGIPAGNYLLEITPSAGDAARYYSVGYGGDPVEVTAGATENYSFQLPLLPSDPNDFHNIPVVLVRGLGPAGDNESGYWAALRDHLTAEGFTNVWVPNEFLRPNSTSPVVNGELGVFDNASALDAFLATKVAQYKQSHQGASPKAIRFVCHSMGGLIVRQLLSPKSRNLPPVSDVVMLSTPNAGSALADIKAAIYPFNDWSDDIESIFQLRTSFVRDVFNSTVKWPSGDNVRLFIAGGTNGSGDSLLEAGNVALKLNSPSGDQLNDGAVTLLSSQGKYITGDYSKTTIALLAFLSRPTTKASFSDARVTAAEQVALNHSTITSDPAILGWVTEILSGRTPDGIGTIRAAARSAPMVAMRSEINAQAQAMSESTHLPDQLIDRVSGSVVAGAVATSSIPVDSTAKVVFAATIKGSGDFSLVDPANNVIVATGGNVTRQEIADGGTKIVQFEIINPTVGVWQMKVDATASPGPVGYELQALCESTFALAGSQGERFRQGASVPLSAALGDSGSESVIIVPGASIEASLESPAGVIVEGDLLDDGTQVDGEAGDGVFGCTVNPASGAGWHTVKYRAQGVHPVTGEAFSRVVEGQICVGLDAGFISGEPSYETLDSDENGFADSVRVEIPVSVSGPGTYVLSGKLVDVETGTEMPASSTFVREAASTANVTLLFSPRDLPEGQAFGPFDLQKVDLFRQVGEPEWADRFNGSLRVYTTLYNEISRSIRLTGDLSFGTVPVGQQTSRNLTIHNDGWESLDVSSLSLPFGFSAAYEGSVEPGEAAVVPVTFSPQSESTYSGIGSAVSNAAAGESTISLTGQGGAEQVAMSDWLSRKGVPPNQQGATDDPSHRGLPNILAYLFNVHPLNGPASGDQNAILRGGLHNNGVNDFLTLRYRKNRNAVGLNVTVETSVNLQAGSWQTVIPDETVTVGTDSLTGDPVIEVRIKMGAGSRLFGRLKVVEQGP